MAAAISKAAGEAAEAASDEALAEYETIYEAAKTRTDAIFRRVLDAGVARTGAAAKADARAGVSNDTNAARDQALRDYRVALSDETTACA